MFGSSSKPPAPAPERKQDMSLIAQGVTLTGDIDGAGDVSIDGTFQGKIKCRKLIIGETGSFRGQAPTPEPRSQTIEQLHVVVFAVVA